MSIILHKKFIPVTIFLWLIVTVGYAYFYIQNVLAQPGLEGYEAEWQFQLLMFSIFRLPYLFAVLIAIIVIIKKFSA